MSSIPSELRQDTQYNNQHHTLQQTPGFSSPYPENARRVKEEGEDNQKRNYHYLKPKEDKPPADSIIMKREASVVHYCRNCGNTINGKKESDKPCANCDGEMVLSTL